MSRFRGIYIASFAVGIVIPVTVILILISKIPDTHEIIESAPVQTVEVPASTVDIFEIEYDRYGQYVLGEELVQCLVINSHKNEHTCLVYLQDTGGVLTEISEVPHSNRVLSLKIVENRWTDTGEYPVTLVYEVITDSGNTTIECPFILNVNRER